jgi:dihydropteroate synthase
MSELLVWRVGQRVLDCSARTQVMGVLNITPDSFSDGGVHFDLEVAVAAGLRMVEDGADMLDVGGESTRPGSEPVPVFEEIARVVPVIDRLVSRADVPISVDTRKPEVAAAALEAGASIVNDVSAGTFDQTMFGVVQGSGAGMVLMHMRGTPATMQQLTDYKDVVGEVKAFLGERIEAAVSSGIERERLAVDPGLGFAKNFQQSLLLMNRNDVFAELGRPVLVGPSRKSFIGQVTGTEADQRVEGTAGAVAWLASHGAHIGRVHDVKEMVRAVRVVDAIRRAERESTPP